MSVITEKRMVEVLETKYICDICKFETRVKDNLDTHCIANHSYVCEKNICGKNFYYFTNENDAKKWFKLCHIYYIRKVHWKGEGFYTIVETIRDDERNDDADMFHIDDYLDIKISEARNIMQDVTMIKIELKKIKQH